jgi:polysaccharide biosynthesis/export protein
VIKITVLDQPDLTIEETIRPDGNISFPLIGDVYAEGLTTLQLRKIIHQQLGNYLKDMPLDTITVTVTEFNSKKIYVYGYGVGVKEIPYTGDVTILDAVVQSGIFNRSSNPKGITLIRGESDTRKKPQGLKVNLVNIFNGRTENNIVLKDKDLVYIPPTMLGRIGFKVQSLLFPVEPVLSAGGTASNTQFRVLNSPR